MLCAQTDPSCVAGKPQTTAKERCREIQGEYNEKIQMREGRWWKVGENQEGREKERKRRRKKRKKQSRNKMREGG